MKRFTRIIATLLLGTMLMTTLTGCNQYYYYYYINNTLGGSGSSSGSTGGNFNGLLGSSDDSGYEVGSLIASGIWNQASSVTDGNPSNLTKAWARILETVIPHWAFGNEMRPEKLTLGDTWANKHWQSVTVIASEEYDKMAKECGLVWRKTVNNGEPVVDGDVLDAAKRAVSEYGEKYNLYFVTIINQPVNDKPKSTGSRSPDDFFHFWAPLGLNMIGVTTDSNPNDNETFNHYYDEHHESILYTVGTYRIDENYIALMISAS
mgnify:FL=1